jgi:phosphatidylinositol alpha-1,6-mannosyltransferase
MTTLLITEVFPPRHGGSGRLLWEQYRRWLPAEVVVVAGEHPDQAAFDSTHDLRVLRLPLALRSWGLSGRGQFCDFWRLLRAIRQIVRSHRVGAIHCGKCLPEGLMALALKCWTGLPYACYLHGEELKFVTSSRELSWLTRRVLRGADLLIANSRNTAAIATQTWDVPPNRVRILHPGVDTRQFVPAARDPVARARLGWHERPVVLTVGRLQRRKGQDMMIAALQAVRRVCPDVLYAIVGDGEERAALEDQSARAGLTAHVQFLGERPDDELLTCYQQCDLFALPNRQVGQDIEGFGMVLVEAQACGKPVVAGASGGTAETMQVPDTGLIVPCEQPEPLAAVVAELLSDSERLARMGAAGRRWVVDHFDWDILSRQAFRLWHEREYVDQIANSYAPGSRVSPVTAREPATAES